MLSLRAIDTDDVVATSIQHHPVFARSKASALDALIGGQPLSQALIPTIKAIESVWLECRCVLMKINQDGFTLSPVASSDLPTTFLSALKHIIIDADSGSCGAAVYERRPHFASNVSVHPNWQPLQHLIAEHNIHSCCSYPVVLSDSSVFGSLALYSESVIEPTQQERERLAQVTQLIADIIERANQIHSLRTENRQLQESHSDSTKQLTEANLLLRKALEQRNEVRNQLIEMENMAALGTMMSSLTHEINTPVGVAITAISHLSEMLQQSSQALQNDTLTRSNLIRTFNETSEAADIIERNLFRATELIKTFKQLSIDQHSQDARPLNMTDYIDEVLLSLKPRLKHARHLFCIDVDPDLAFVSNPGAISQLLINLIMNSASHAFEPHQRGRIIIKSRRKGKYVVIEYKDNGKGMTDNTIENLYRPFFTLAKDKGGSGLGMHICYNLAVKVLRGSIDCQSSPGRGVHFTIQFPV
ncbi:GAF domain-containing sensor histidine kinase [Aestuariibacter salexigens]|uniref:sensor histidine kinase n=1 Tax=Aestuariibacter salexigens TaxID=226010 RepID=UPI00040DB88B|nr:GAF domain-containing sensor histidine kinase [Aestuariibacter salexigens]